MRTTAAPRLSIRSFRYPAAAFVMGLLATAAAAQDVVLPGDAAKRIGEKCTVEFIVKSTGTSNNPKKPTAGFVHLGTLPASGEEASFAVTIAKTDIGRFSSVGSNFAAVEQYYLGKLISVTGVVQSSKAGSTIQVNSPTQIRIVSENPVDPNAYVPTLQPDDFDPRPPSYVRFYLVGLGVLLIPIWATLRSRKKRAEESD